MEQHWRYCMATMMMMVRRVINKVRSTDLVILLVLYSPIKKHPHLLSSPAPVWKINQVDVAEGGLGYQSDNLHYLVSFGNLLHRTDVFLVNISLKDTSYDYYNRSDMLIAQVDIRFNIMYRQ
jgi:hypothetical protein